MTQYDEFLRLASLETDECVIWPYSTSRGYPQVYVPTGDGKGPQVYGHRLALERRVPSPAPGMQVLHGPCHETRCINYRHLSWRTPAENATDQLRDGTRRRGGTHHLSRLTDEQRAEVLSLHRLGESQRRLAVLYSVTPMTINRLVRGVTWTGRM